MIRMSNILLASSILFTSVGLPIGMVLTDTPITAHASKYPTEGPTEYLKAADYLEEHADKLKLIDTVESGDAYDNKVLERYRTFYQGELSGMRKTLQDKKASELTVGEQEFLKLSIEMMGDSNTKSLDIYTKKTLNKLTTLHKSTKNPELQYGYYILMNYLFSDVEYMQPSKDEQAIILDSDLGEVISKQHDMSYMTTHQVDFQHLSDKVYAEYKQAAKEDRSYEIDGDVLFFVVSILVFVSVLLVVTILI